MLNQAAAVALRIALFRAGPQDMPFAPALMRITLPLALLAAFLQYRLTLPTPAALAHALGWVAALALFTHVVLQSRGLANRFRQTLDSLLLVDSAMTALMLPALAVLAVSLWNFLVTAHVYRHALDARPAVGALVALLATLVTVSLAGALGALFA